MSNWPRVKLRELCSKIGSGATPHGGAAVYIDAGTSLIRSQNVYNVKFEYEGLAHITADAAKRLDGVTVEPGDVLLNITGDSVARTCVVPDNVLPARVNQHVAIIRADPERLDYRYLNYYLASPFMQAHMLGLAVGKGASRNAITKAMIENFSIPLPPLPEQRRIADILSAYDDLIDNNRKQIKLLEEAAQRLYKEWFIDLRFPGHEHTPIVNGIPAGWKKTLLANLVEIKYGKDHKGIADGNIPVYGSGGLMRKCCKALYVGEAVLIPRKGSLNNIMYVNEAFWTVDTMFYAIPKWTSLGFCVYFFLRTLDMYSLDIGSAVPSMTTSILNSLEMLLPAPDSLEKFQQAVYVYFQQISLRRHQNDELTEARDRFLGKLLCCNG